MGSTPGQILVIGNVWDKRSKMLLPPSNSPLTEVLIQIEVILKPDRSSSSHSVLLPLELLEHEAAEDHVEEDGGEDDAGAPPAAIAVHQPLGEGGEEEGSDP